MGEVREVGVLLREGKFQLGVLDVYFLGIHHKMVVRTCRVPFERR